MSTENVLANYFEVNVAGNVYRYKVDIEPNPPNRLYALNRGLRLNRQALVDQFGAQYIFLNGSLFTKKSPPNLTLEAEIDNTKYTLRITNEGLLDAESEATREMFIARLFKILQAKLKLKPVGRSYFDPTKSYTSNGLDIWPGYKTSLNCLGGKFYLNIDSVSKVLRKDTALEAIEEARQAAGQGWENKVRQNLIGNSVNTKYNKQIYKIDDVDFTQSPRSTFRLEDGKEVSYVDYYRDKYKFDVSNLDQPLLVNKPKKGKLKCIYLIPEFCLMTGLSDKMRKDFNFMRDVTKVIKPAPGKRMGESIELAKLFGDDKRCQETMSEWDVRIMTNPLGLQSKHLDSGCMLMGENKRFHFEKSKTLDRDVQTTMLEARVINKVVIFYPGDGKQALETFKNNSQQCLSDMKYQVKEMVEVEVRNFRKEDEWINLSDRYIDQSVSCVIYILNGPKKAGFNYAPLKRVMLNRLPVPSQMVLAKTLQGKNLRSIVYRIWIQINAKLGGVPWGIDSLPFVDRPTMVVGIDYSQAGKMKKGVAFLATVNSTLARYWSTFRSLPPGTDENEILKECLVKAIQEFEKLNGIAPERIFVFREGASGMGKGVNTSIKLEVAALQRAVSEYCNEKSSKTGKQVEELEKSINLVMIAVNKNIGAKFYTGSSRQDLGNPSMGTLVDTIVTNGDQDFYLVSQRTLQGTATPTHYHIFHNDLSDRGHMEIKDVRKGVAMLSYKLCFLYYNTVGSIKTPAPVHYAARLSELLENNKDRKEELIPHAHLGNTKSLYFI